MFPLFFDLTDKLCLVIGGGRVASRKAHTLSAYGAKVQIIAKRCCEEICSSAICWEERDFIPTDLQGVFLAVVATDDKDFNNYIAQLCNEKKILVNRATPGSEESVAFPSVLKRGSTVIGINSDGNPMLSKKLRQHLEQLLPAELEQISQDSRQFRQEKKENCTGQELKDAMTDYLQEKLNQQ